MSATPPPSPAGGRPGPLAITTRPLAWLKPYPANARKHSPDQVARLAESVKRFGFTNPILATADGTIVAGHGRTAAAALAGLEEVPVIVLDLSPSEARAYCLADNRLADLAEWDEDLLAQELSELTAEDPALLEAAGFTEGEVSVLLNDDMGKDELPDEDLDAPAPPFLCPHCGREIDPE